MAIYEYYCPSCREKFELRRPMSEAKVAVKCASGHPAERALSMFAAPRGGAAIAEMPDMSAGGGCCGGGGGCACGH
jgi:putative FmdB family regulatory protein